jgi:hypothetical protein
MDVGQSPWFTDVDGLAMFVYQGVIFELPAGRFTVDGFVGSSGQCSPPSLENGQRRWRLARRLLA